MIAFTVIGVFVSGYLAIGAFVSIAMSIAGTNRGWAGCKSAADHAAVFAVETILWPAFMVPARKR